MPDVIKFVKEKDTKNTVRFKEQPEPGQPNKVGTLYVQSWYAGEKTEITVTIE